MSVYKQGLITLILVVFSTFAQATGSLRCDGQLIEQGATKAEVVAACGEPASRKEDGMYWFYDQGSPDLITRVYFVGDKVEFIDDDDRD